MEELQSHVPETTKFTIGYQERRNSTKRWICCKEDIQAMYEAYKDCPKKEILLWCDGQNADEENEDSQSIKRRKIDGPPA